MNSSAIPPPCAPGAGWNQRGDGGAFARRGFRLKITADHLQAFSHAEQLQVLSFAGAHHGFHLEGFVVIYYFHTNQVCQLLDARFHPAGLRVTEYIGKRLLRYAKQHHALGRVQLLHLRERIKKL